MSNVVSFEEALLRKRDEEFEKRVVLDREFIATALRTAQKNDPKLDAELCRIAWEDKNS